MDTFLGTIDAHQHLWDITDEFRDWPQPNDGDLFRSYRWRELGAHLQRHGITGTILVQTNDSEEENLFLARCAAENDEILGFVGWVPLDEPSRAESVVSRLSAYGKCVGSRSLIHRMSDPAWLMRPAVSESLQILEDRAWTFDVVSEKTETLRQLPNLAQRHPSMSFIVDHLSKPPLGGHEAASWAAALRECAALPNVYAKLSGLYPPNGPFRRWQVEDLREPVETAIEAFGPARLMIGSDWPVCELWGGFDHVWTTLLQLLSGLREPDRNGILGENARRVYLKQ